MLPYRLHFKFPARTSRGVMYVKDTYLLLLEKDGRKGGGECALFKGLSADDRPEYEEILRESARQWEAGRLFDAEEWRRWPSLVFGWETALASLAGDRPDVLFPSPFTRGEEGIPINGLIWMGDKDFMLRQIEEKIERGFRVIKIKIGALHFEDELDLIRHIRRRFSSRELEIRTDANGAFRPEEALDKLERLARWNVHSVEQPIRAGQPEAMAEICEKSPVPVALDEELIGVFDPSDKRRLLRYIRPSYIILKPSLAGGFSGTKEWIRAAEEAGAGWWITSALESNVGLNAIAQFTARLGVHMPQGLGTGGLFTDNFPSPLYLEGDTLRFDPARRLQVPGL
ncbi:MAG: o-succinylbenzoate synthase [Chlorobi bacterium]|nr:o-succinylbenzoate synthase [Chlorobiota bacterium]